jgi:hypothetical protein
MTLAWIDRAVLRALDLTGAEPLPAAIADATALGVSALLLRACRADAGALAPVVDAAHAADLLVCAEFVPETGAHPDGLCERIGGWLAAGVDAVRLPSASPNTATIIDRFSERTFVADWAEPHAGAATEVPALMTTTGGEDSVAAQIRATAVFTLPGLPVVERAGARTHEYDHLVEQLVYLRQTEADLALGSAYTALDAAPGTPVEVFRRGEALVVALNGDVASHRVRLVHVGDVTPVLAHHCEAHHDAEGWWLKIGPRSFGVFTAR